MLRLLALATILAGCFLALPAPECDPGTAAEQRELTCAAAVNAALSAVADRHAAIERIQFLYGCAKPCGGRLQLGVGPPARGYVVFTYRDGSATEYVDVTLGDDGAVQAADPADY